MVKILQKMGWQSLCLVVSTTQDGKIFAEAMNSLALKEKWTVLSILWIDGDEDLSEISTGIQNVVQRNPDVIIGHFRQRLKDNIFWTIQKLQAFKNSSAWLLSDVTIYGLRNISTVPSGVVMVSAKSHEIGHDYELYVNALYDSFAMFESAFERAFADLSKDERQNCSTSGKSERLQRTAMK